MSSSIAHKATARDLRPTKDEIREYLQSLPENEVRALVRDFIRPIDDPIAEYETAWEVWRLDGGAAEWVVARDEAGAIELSRRNWVEVLGEARGDFEEPDSVERLPPGKALSMGREGGGAPFITAPASAWANFFSGPQWLGSSEY